MYACDCFLFLIVIHVDTIRHRHTDTDTRTHGHAHSVSHTHTHTTTGIFAVFPTYVCVFITENLFVACIWQMEMMPSHLCACTVQMFACVFVYVRAICSRPSLHNYRSECCTNTTTIAGAAAACRWSFFALSHNSRKSLSIGPCARMAAVVDG